MKFSEIEIELIEEAFETHLNSLMEEDYEDYSISYALLLKKIKKLKGAEQ